MGTVVRTDYNETGAQDEEKNGEKGEMKEVLLRSQGLQSPKSGGERGTAIGFKGGGGRSEGESFSRRGFDELSFCPTGSGRENG